jgi:hypothetical protein
LCGCIIGVLLAQLLLWVDRTVHIKTLMHYSPGTATGVLTRLSARWLPSLDLS